MAVIKAVRQIFCKIYKYLFQLLMMTPVRYTGHAFCQLHYSRGVTEDSFVC